MDGTTINHDILGLKTILRLMARTYSNHIGVGEITKLVRRFLLTYVAISIAGVTNITRG